MKRLALTVTILCSGGLTLGAVDAYAAPIKYFGYNDTFSYPVSDYFVKRDKAFGAAYALQQAKAERDTAKAAHSEAKAAADKAEKEFKAAEADADKAEKLRKQTQQKLSLMKKILSGKAVPETKGKLKKAKRTLVSKKKLKRVTGKAKSKLKKKRKRQQKQIKRLTRLLREIKALRPITDEQTVAEAGTRAAAAAFQAKTAKAKLAAASDNRKRTKDASAAAAHHLERAKKKVAAAEKDHKLAQQQWNAVVQAENGRMNRNLFYTKGSRSNVVRYNVLWDWVEKTPGKFDWSYYDWVYRKFVNSGQRPLLVAIGAPCWARPSILCDGRAADPDPQFMWHWRKFVYELTKRYPQAIGIEIWNEPNDANYWGPGRGAPAYLELLKWGYHAVKDADPLMPVVLAGMNPHAKLPDGGDWLAMLNRLYKNGAGNYSDVLGLHPYPSKAPVTDDVMKKVQQAKDVRAANKAGGWIWVTEIGLATDPRAGAIHVTLKNQSKRLVEIHNKLAKANVEMMIVHRLHDVPWLSPWEASMGVIAADGRPKPAFCALAALRGPKFC